MTERPVKADLSRLRLDDSEKREGSVGRRSVPWLVGVAIATLVVLGVAFALHRGAGGARNEQERSVAPATAPAQPATSAASGGSSSAREIAAGGYVEARRSSVTMPGRDGVVARVHVREGQQVEEGTLLLELESAVEEAAVEIARADVELSQARLRRVRSGSRVEEVQAADADSEAAEAARDEAQRNLERLESLLPMGATAAADVDRARQRARGAEARFQALRSREQLVRRGSRPVDVAAAQAEVSRAEAALRRAGALLELARLRAPFAGVVTTIDVEPGEVVSVQAGAGGIEIADISTLLVRVDIPETRIRFVQLDAPVRIIVDAIREDPMEGRVVAIDSIADRQSNTVEVAISLLEPPPLIRPNMSARVSIEARGETP